MNGARARKTNRHLGQSRHHPATAGSWMRKPALQLMNVAWWAGSPAKARLIASSEYGRSSEK